MCLHASVHDLSCVVNAHLHNITNSMQYMQAALATQRRRQEFSAVTSLLAVAYLSCLSCCIAVHELFLVGVCLLYTSSEIAPNACQKQGQTSDTSYLSLTVHYHTTNDYHFNST